MKPFFVLIIFGALFFLTSCEKEIPLVLSKTMKIEVDSIYTAQLDSLSEISDSICDMNYDKFFKTAKDSIKIQRLREIEDIIDE